MSTKLLRMMGTLLVAFGLIAGTLGTAVAGTEGLDLDALEPDGTIATDGGSGGDGGTTGTQTGGGTNDNGNTQGNGQDQTQTPGQNQDVSQGNGNELDQDNDLDSAAGADAGGDCAITQPDDQDVVVDEDEDADNDEVADEDGDVTNGDGGGDCALGDSEASDASTGDTNQANTGDADAANTSSQDQASGDQDNANAPGHANEQDLTNDLDAEAGDGAEGGAAANSGDLNLTNGIVATLVRIMASIIDDEEPVPDDEPAPTCDGTITIVFTWGPGGDLDAHLSGPDTEHGGRFHLYNDAMNPVRYASLDVDAGYDTTNTETVTITTPTGDGAFVAGDYHYWVYKYNRNGFGGAVVTVQCDGQQLAQFSVANASGDATQRIWHVFNFNLTITGEVTITPVQQFRQGDDEEIVL